MKCNHPQIKKLVGQYQLNLLTDSNEKTLVEAHLISCESCFQECYQLSPVLDLINEKPEYFTEAVLQKESGRQKIMKLFNKFLNPISGIVKLIQQAWSEPPVRILIPVCATVILALIFILPHSSSYPDLAILKKAPYTPVGFRGHVQLTDPERLFEEAMTAYNQNHYSEAIGKLNEYCSQEPDNACVHFYLGISCIMNKDLNQGIKHLEISEAICRESDNLPLLNECLWTLGNVYLKLESPDRAMEYLSQNLEIEGADQNRITNLIRKIEEMKSP